jgi:AcrR family transcriptional regulator
MSEADEAIMDAVDQALRKHGYAELTMQDIADESEKSKSLLHYHYDTKEDLLVAFLDNLVSDYDERMACRDGQPPTKRLVEFLAWFVFTPDDTGREQFHLALLEMRSQGPFNDRIREQLVKSDDTLRDTAADIITEGIEAGVFEGVDPERTAALLVATLDGARTRQITLGSANETYTRTVVEQALEQIVEPMLVAGVELPDLDEVLAEIKGEE